MVSDICLSSNTVCVQNPSVFKGRECGERVSFPPKGDFSGWRMWQPRILSQEDPSPILQRTVQSHVVVGSWIRMLIPWLPGTKKNLPNQRIWGCFFRGKNQKKHRSSKNLHLFQNSDFAISTLRGQGVTSMRCKQSKPLELHTTNLSSPFLSFRWCVGSVVRRSSSRIASWPPQGMPSMWRDSLMEQGKTSSYFLIQVPWLQEISSSFPVTTRRHRLKLRTLGEDKARNGHLWKNLHRNCWGWLWENFDRLDGISKQVSSLDTFAYKKLPKES